jgi:hypothetical protein
MYHRRAYDHAQDVLPELIELAKSNSVINYGTLMENINCSRRWIGKALYTIDAVARRLHLPRINLLAVAKQTQLPSDSCEIYYGSHEEFRATCTMINWDEAGPRLISELNKMCIERGF